MRNGRPAGVVAERDAYSCSSDRRLVLLRERNGLAKFAHPIGAVNRQASIHGANRTAGSKHVASCIVRVQNAVAFRNHDHPDREFVERRRKRLGLQPVQVHQIADRDARRT